MKLSAIFLSALIAGATFSITFDKTLSATKVLKPRKLLAARPDRKMVQNLTSSYLLGNTPDAMNTSHLQMLVNQQKAMQNFKQINTWVSDLEERLDDLRDTINRRVSDMAIGMQRRNMLIAHHNYMGEATGYTLNGIGGSNAISAA